MQTFVADVQTVPAAQTELFRFNNPLQGFLTMQNVGGNNLNYSIEQSTDGGMNWGVAGCTCSGAPSAYPYTGILVPSPSPQAFIGIPIQTNATLIRVMGSGNTSMQFSITRQIQRADFGPIPGY